MKKKIVLAGGSGFLGESLARSLTANGHDVVVLTRSPEEGNSREIGWDGRTVGSWAEALEGAAAIVNLTGKSVNCRYTEANKREIIESA